MAARRKKEDGRYNLHVMIDLLQLIGLVACNQVILA